MAIRRNTGSRVFDLVNTILVSLAVIVCVIPFLYIIAESFSSNSAILTQKVTLYPIGFTLLTYKTVFLDRAMDYSLIYSVFLTVLYTLMSMAVTILAAYPLTKKRLKGRSFFLGLIMFTMYFSGGLIPDYILVKNLHLLNTIWSLVLPGMLNVYNMIILKSFFQSLPDSLLEAASLDGCTEVGTLFRIVLPLSLPSIATISLFYAVARWDGFRDALFYITQPRLYPIQLKLYQVINVSQSMETQMEGSVGQNVAPDGLKAASVMFATVPILLVYPWLQKYFVSGVMLGAVKG